jgi:hypothetical protein
MWGLFSDVGAYENHVIESTNLSAAETAVRLPTRSSISK